MSVYFIANITIHDPDQYQKYLEGSARVFDMFRGEYLAVDSCPLVLEGDWRHDRLVIIRFPDEMELRRWYYSAEYQELLAFRLAGARCDSLLVRGKT